MAPHSRPEGKRDARGVGFEIAPARPWTASWGELFMPSKMNLVRGLDPRAELPMAARARVRGLAKGTGVRDDRREHPQLVTGA